MTDKKRIHTILASLLLLASFLPLAFAQPGPTPGVSILGQVNNEDGTPAPGASIEIVDLQTNQTYTATANETGWYVIYNIDAVTGDRFDVTATLGDLYGHRTTTITATSPLFTVNITLSENTGGTIPIMWIAAILGVIMVVIVFALYVRSDNGKSPPKRRRK